MGKLKILVLGDGILGSQLVKQSNWNYISRKKDNFDITKKELWNFSNYDVIVNCIANTDTYSTNRDLHWLVNYVFVNDLITYCNDNNIKLVHISTEYLYTGSISNASEEDVPVHCNNWYGYTKLLGDGLVQLLSKDYLICRCMHKIRPFPYENAWVDQIGNFDYVDIISKLIINIINDELTGIYNIGTEIKSIYELALRTKIVNPTKATEEAPKDVTMDVSKLQKLNYEL
jgi:dTDP-4-dehydrorhamnose reductase